MKNFILTPVIAAALLTIGPIVHSQVPPAPAPSTTEPVTPPQPKINLTVEQRHTIKELIKDMHVQAVSGDFPVGIGDTVPPTVKIQPMPAEIAAKVPQVKSHAFFLMDDRVVLVSPKDNKIADVIE